MVQNLRSIGLAILLVLVTSSAWAATYYVNDTNTVGPWDGTTHATGFRTVAQVNAKAFAAGDDVYFRCGGVWHEMLVVDWSGTGDADENRSIVGAYYMSGETPVIGVPEGGTKPLFDGMFTLPFYDPAPPVPGGSLITINGDYVTLQDVKVYRSTESGIRVYNTAYATGTYSQYVSLKRVDSDWAWGGVLTILVTDHFLAEDCDFSRGAYVVNLKCSNNTAYCRDIGYGDPATITHTFSSRYGTYRRCTIRDSYNEGINLDSGGPNAGHHNTVEYCKIYGNYKGNLYVVHQDDATVRYNLIYGTNPNAGGLNATKASTWGIWVSVEDYWGVTGDNFYIYGNVVANTAGNLWVGAQSTSNEVNNAYIYNNTFMNPASTGAYNVSITSGTGHIFKNNIIVGAGTSGIAEFGSGVVTPDYNLWSTQPADTDARGAHDPAAATPTLSRTSSWITTITGGSISMSDASPTAELENGEDLGDDYDEDYAATDRDVAAGGDWDVGAIEYVGAGATSCGDTSCNGAEVCGADDTPPACNTDCGACAGATALKVHWKMETESTPEQDDTANNLDLTLSGTTRVTGLIDTYARSFNGTSDYAYRAAISGLKAQFSLCGWFKPSNVSGYKHLFGTYDNYYRLGMYNSTVYFGTYDTGYRGLSSTATCTANAWNFVCATYDGTTKKLYLNDAAVVTQTASPPAQDDQINIGRTAWTDSYEYFTGLIDDVRIYDGAITAEQVATLYAMGAPDEDTRAPVVTEYQRPTVPLSGAPVYKFVSDEAGTLTLVGPCTTTTTEVTEGINEITFTTLGKGSYFDCSVIVTDASDNAATLAISPFAVDYWTLVSFGTGTQTITPAAGGGVTLYFGGALPE